MKTTMNFLEAVETGKRIKVTHRTLENVYYRNNEYLHKFLSVDMFLREIGAIGNPNVVKDIMLNGEFEVQ